MLNKVLYSFALIALLSMATVNQAQPVGFSVNAVYDAMVANDASQGPDQSAGGSGLHIRDIDVISQLNVLFQRLKFNELLRC